MSDTTTEAATAAGADVTEAASHLVTAGWLMILGGIGVTIWAFNFNVGISTGSYAAYGAPTAVANMDLVATRSMILASGLAAFVAGWVALAGGLIIRALRP